MERKIKSTLSSWICSRVFRFRSDRKRIWNNTRVTSPLFLTFLKWWTRLFISIHLDAPLLTASFTALKESVSDITSTRTVYCLWRYSSESKFEDWTTKTLNWINHSILVVPSYRGELNRNTPLIAISQAYAFASRPLHILNVDCEPCIASNLLVPFLLLYNMEAREVGAG